MLNIFIGSSSEGLCYAEDLCHVLDELRARPRLWNDDGMFLPGKTIVEGIDRLGKIHDAAVLIATKDDRTIRGGHDDWTPRDNVVFETGYFSGLYGRGRSIIVKVGAARLPSDLGGVVYIEVPEPTRDAAGDYDHDRFRRALKDKLRPWIKDCVAGLNVERQPAALLPKLTETLTTQLARMQRTPGWEKEYDAVASDLLTSLDL
jgi:predicted nucleotide-binding protein